ncbi:MAG: hypothetical protein U5K27_03560 [Desulfotignum sp.]|nr:hypothetical protein [Desulfotignum sp.]
MIDIDEYHPDDYKLRDMEAARKEVDGIVDIILTPTEKVTLKPGLRYQKNGA